MADGTISFQTKLDDKGLYRDLERVEDRIRKLAEEVQRTEGRKNDLADRLKEARMEADRTRASVGQLQAQIAESEKITAVPVSSLTSVEDIDRQREALRLQEQLRKDLTKQEKALSRQERAVERVSRSYGAEKAALDRLTQELERQREISLETQRHIAGRAGSSASRRTSSHDTDTGDRRIPAEEAYGKMERIAGRMEQSLRRTFLAFSLLQPAIQSAFQKMTDWIGEMIRQNDRAAAAIARLQGALLTMAQPLVNVVIPAFTVLVELLTRVAETFAELMSFIFGTTASGSAKAAKAMYEEANGLTEVKDAAEDAAGSLASFDEINTIQTEPQKNTPTKDGAKGIQPDFSAFDEDKIRNKIDELMVCLSGALLAVGALLFFSGVNMPLGLALMVIGAAGLVRAVMANWNGGGKEIQSAIDRTLIILGSAFLVIGAILLFTGIDMPLGLALMAIGAAMLAADANMDWRSMDGPLRDSIAGSLVLYGIVAVVIGAILVFTGVNIPLGVALIASGALAVAAAATLDWGEGGLSEELTAAISGILFVIGLVAFVLGVLLMFVGPATWPYGIGLMLLGAASVTAAVGLNWDRLGDTIQEKLGTLLKVVGGMIALIGVVLLLSGANIPVGIALVIAGIALFTTGTALVDWDALGDTIHDKLSELLAIAGAFLAIIGIILCFTGHIPLGVGFLIGGIALFTASAVAANWDLLGGTLEEKLKNIASIVGAFIAVLGVILLLAVPAVMPLALGMILLGSGIFLVSQIAAQWDRMGETVREKIAGILKIISSAMLVLGAILLFGGPPFWPLAFGLLGVGAGILGVSQALPKWDALKTRFVQMWNDIRNWWRTGPSKYFTLNYWKDKAADMINGLVNGIRSGISSVGSALASLFSGSDTDISVSTSPVAVTRSAASTASAYPASIRAADVPALARGAVIPANREFLAVLGDQKNGRNLEAPEALLRQIAQEGNAEIVTLLKHLLAAVKGGKTIYLDGKKIADNTVRHINDRIDASGTIPLHL